MQSNEREGGATALKSRRASIMHACESLAVGAGRKRDLRGYVRFDQRPPAQDLTVESSGCCIARRGANDCNRCDHPGTRISRHQLRHACIAVGHDAHLGVIVLLILR